MNRYDWGWDRSYDWSFRPRRPRGYGFGAPRHADWRGRPEGSWSWGVGAGERWEMPHGAGSRGGYDRGGYDRGVYGSPYPTYGGYPGADERGMYYGHPVAPRPFPGYDRGFRGRYGPGFAEGFGRTARQATPGWGREERYDRGIVQEPFLPESAYERHPELDRPQRHQADRWPAEAHDVGVERDDDEIRQSVRQNLFNDSWVKADRIHVEVAGQVVTLKGEVDDYLEARYAWDDAWEAEGVRGVINQLTVRTDEPTQPHGDVLPQTGGGKKGKK